MASAVIFLARRRAVIAQTLLHRFEAFRLSTLSSSSPFYSSSAAADNSFLSSFAIRSRFTSTSAAPTEGGDDGHHGLSSVEGDLPQNQHMRRGDWVCSRCNFMNFGRNLFCLRCKADDYNPNPRREHFDNVEMREGDWTCPGCNFMNFARNKRCLRCRSNRPGYDALDMDDGRRYSSENLPPFGRLDWTCPKCQYVNFARNSACLRCEEPRPSVQLRNGEWECPSCRFLNFSGNPNCHKCNLIKPNDATTCNQGVFSSATTEHEDIDALIKDYEDQEEEKQTSSLSSTKDVDEQNWKLDDDDFSVDEDVDSIIQDLRREYSNKQQM